MRLLKSLLSRIEMKEFYPSKGKKKEKQPLKYFHTHGIFDYKDPITGVVRPVFVGITYRK